jgi:hypothetical protein
LHRRNAATNPKQIFLKFFFKNVSEQNYHRGVHGDHDEFWMMDVECH